MLCNYHINEYVGRGVFFERGVCGAFADGARGGTKEGTPVRLGVGVTVSVVPRKISGYAATAPEEVSDEALTRATREERPQDREAGLARGLSAKGREASTTAVRASRAREVLASGAAAGRGP